MSKDLGVEKMSCISIIIVKQVTTYKNCYLCCFYVIKQFNLYISAVRE